jgi:HEPN domain-containing protein
MSKRDAIREARRWQLQAENDLAYAEVGLRAGYAAQTCFMAQQIAEKALKAVALARGDRQARGHSCAKLGARIASEIRELEQMGPQLLELDQYYVPARYPNGVPSGAPFEAYSIEQARGALRIGADIVRLTRARLATAHPGWEQAEDE